VSEESIIPTSLRIESVFPLLPHHLVLQIRFLGRHAKERAGSALRKSTRLPRRRGKRMAGGRMDMGGIRARHY
jgi:hypothetical protein